MKNTIKYLFGCLFLAVFVAACTPEKFEGINEAGLPEASAFKSNVFVSVDQTTNQITCEFKDAPGVYPMWEIMLPNGKVDKSTLPSFSKIYINAGTYTVNVRIANHNGVSDSFVTETVKIENTIFDFDKYYKMLSNATWYIAQNEKGHMGCGGSVANPTEWWSADPKAKASEGVYDNELTFSADKTYTFNPGAGGTIYVNTGCSLWPEFNPGDGNDFRVPVETQTTSYNLEVEGEDLYITFPSGTYFPYIAFDAIWNTPRYKVVNMSNKKMTLVISSQSICWQYILTTEKSEEKKFTGFTYNQPDNIWLQANPTFKSQYYAHGDSWESYPEYEHTEGDNLLTVSLPGATNNQWQAQYQLDTQLDNALVPVDATYDMSIVLHSTTDLPGVTIKLTSQTDDVSLVDTRFPVPADEDFVFYVLNMPGQDLSAGAPYKLVFDFGGNPENTEVTIKNIVLIDHSKNTELDKVPGEDDPVENVDWVDVDSPDNLMTSGNFDLSGLYWAAGDDWHGVANADVAIEGRKALITIAEDNGTNQWQGQVHFNTGVAIEEGQAYDFSITFKASQDYSGVTVKPHPEGDDAHFFSEGRHDLSAYDEVMVQYINCLAADYSTGNLIITLDFPGSMAGTTIEVKDIIVQKHK